MSLRPYANLLALQLLKPEEAPGIVERLRSWPGPLEVRQPHPLWICAVFPLPESAPDPPGAKDTGFAFAEGREEIKAGLGPGGYHRLTRTVRTHPEALDQFPGDFTFFHFDPQGILTAVRSAGGVVPVYFGRFKGRWVVATRLGLFLRWLSEVPPLDPLVNALWAVGWTGFPEGRTFFQGISVLPRGAFVRLQGHRFRIGRYWDPRPRRVHLPRKPDLVEHARRFRQILVSTLEKELDPRGRNLLTLSGGVDSSSLLALAAGTLGFSVMTWTLLPPRNAEALVQHERRYLDPLRRRFRVSRAWEVYLPQEGLVAFWLQGPRMPFHVLHPALCDLDRVRQQAPVVVLFGGEYADQMAGQVMTLSDWAEQTPPLWLLKHRPRIRFLRWWLGYRFRKAQRRPVLPLAPHLLSLAPDGHPLGLFTPEVLEDYRQWYLQLRRRFLQDSRPWRYLHLEAEVTDGFIAMNWEVTSAWGIRRVLPFYRRAMWELVYTLHPVELLGEGMKSLLRRALRRDVPRENLYRPDKGQWGWGLNLQHLSEYRWSWAGPLLPQAFSSILQSRWWDPQVLQAVNYWQYRTLIRFRVFWEGILKEVV